MRDLTLSLSLGRRDVPLPRARVDTRSLQATEPSCHPGDPTTDVRSPPDCHSPESPLLHISPRHRLPGSSQAASEDDRPIPPVRVSGRASCTIKIHTRSLSPYTLSIVPHSAVQCCIHAVPRPIAGSFEHPASVTSWSLVSCIAVLIQFAPLPPGI
jgi:hypothetical protein